MFDIGFFELAIIFVLGIVIIGPERMPEAVRAVMRVWGRLKHTLTETRTEFEKQIGADEIRRELHNERVLKALERTQAKAQAEFKAISERADLNESQKHLKSEIGDTDSLSDNDRHHPESDHAEEWHNDDVEYNDYHAQQHERQEAEEPERDTSEKSILASQEEPSALDSLKSDSDRNA